MMMVLTPLRVTVLTLTVMRMMVMRMMMTAVMMFIQRNWFTLSQESLSQCLMSFNFRDTNLSQYQRSCGVRILL